MVAIPSVNVSVLDGQLGVLEPSAENDILIVGVSSSGTANQVNTITSPAAARSAFGYGPLVEAAAYVLRSPTNNKAAARVFCVRIDPTGGTAASCSSVTTSHTGSGSVATTGSTPYDHYRVRVKCVTAGEVDAAEFQAALDWDGTTGTFGEAFTSSSGTYTIPNTGIVLTFTGGSGADYAVGDTFTFTTVPLDPTNAKITTAIEAFTGSIYEASLVHVACPSAGSDAATKATNLGTRFDALKTAADAAVATTRCMRFVLDGPDMPDANYTDALTGKASELIAVGAGTATIVSVLDSRRYLRNAAWPAMARMAATPVNEDPARVASGPINVAAISRDETTATTSLNAARYITLRTIPGYQGYFITNGLLFATAGSDYDLIQHGRLIDKAVTVARTRLTRFLSDDLEVNDATARPPLVPGALSPLSAQTVERWVQRGLDDALMSSTPPNASSVSFLVDRTVNMLTMRTIAGDVAVVPRGYAKTITARVYLSNPAG